MTPDRFDVIVATVTAGIEALDAIGEAELVEAAAWARGAANAAPAGATPEELRRLLATNDTLNATANYLAEVAR